MKRDNYKLPLNLSRFFGEGGGFFEKCDEIESVNQHINLLLSTCPGEHHFNPRYGCRIWELDFEQNNSSNKWKKMFHDYVAQAILENEKRISNVDVTIDISDIIKKEINDTTMFRKQADIYIKATLNSTELQCALGYKIYLGPISI